MNFNDIYPDHSDYLKAEDLQGKTHSVVIADFTVAEFDRDGKKERKLVLSFQGKDRSLVVNKTNGVRIAGIYGNEIENWRGKRIELYPEIVTFGGKNVNAIRVRVIPPAAEPADKLQTLADEQKAKQYAQEQQVNAQTATPEYDDDIPF